MFAYFKLIILKLGAGCGLPSLYLGSLGSKCIMTDVQAVLYLLNANASLNSHLFEEPIQVVEYPWYAILLLILFYMFLFYFHFSFFYLYSSKKNKNK